MPCTSACASRARRARSSTSESRPRRSASLPCRPISRRCRASSAESLGDAPAVRLRLVAVLPVRVTGDDEEGGRDAAGVLAAEDLREGPVGIGAPREMTDEPVAGVAELAARGGPVAAVDAAGRPVPRGGEPAPRPAPEVVQVVRERDREPRVSPHPARLRQGLEPEGRRGAEPGRRAGAPRSRRRPARRSELGVGGEHAGGVRQATVAVALGRRCARPSRRGARTTRRRDHREPRSRPDPSAGKAATTAGAAPATPS